MSDARLVLAQVESGWPDSAILAYLKTQGFTPEPGATRADLMALLAATVSVDRPAVGNVQCQFYIVLLYMESALGGRW